MRDLAAMTAPVAQPAVRLVTTSSPSRSHFGGVPGLPEGVEWPERSGRPLDFLARLSLAELQAAQSLPWLPPVGALLFFYDCEDQPWGFEPADRSGWRVLLVPDLPQPVADGPTGPVAAHRPAAFKPIASRPSPEHRAFPAKDLTDEEFSAYQVTLDASFGSGPRHQVGGYPRPIQGDSMDLECQLVSHGLNCGNGEAYASAQGKELAAGASDWRLLLQLDTDEAALGQMWGDDGTIYFWIPERAARAGDFDKTWLVLQCY